jgi:Mg/Co/Ni transporter MgtE
MLKKKYFLVYIDILGFEERAEKEAKKTGRPAKDIRKSYVDSIEGRLKELNKDEVIVLYKNAGGLDSWLLFADDIWKTFKSVAEILKAQLPLEVAIGVKDIDKESDRYSIEFEGEVISYLKTGIIGKYRKFFEDTHAEHSPKQTFILLAPEAYKELESKKVKKIARKPYESADFYLLEQKEFERKLEILEFLERVRIGSERIEYREIEELYVKPENYEEIERILKDNNIVFIIGDAEMGKTYTAIKLLFEFFKEGYEPVHISEERRREQWEFVRHKQEFEGKAIYLEDPWGKVEFEKAESFFRHLEDLILRAKSEKCKIIVTSREKVFKEFEKKKETAEDLWKYVSELKVNLAYSEENLREMLKRYIKVFEPAWYNVMKLRKIAFEAVGEKLRTPMSIWKLIARYTEDAKNEEGLKEGIEKAAEETKIAFAREIKEIFNKGEYDKLVFLSFPYIDVKLEVAKSCYMEILKDLGFDLIKATDFDALVEEFNEVEVGWRIRYVHPSYLDAFGHALVDNGKPNNISKKIFSEVLLKVSDIDEAAWNVAFFVANNFDTLPENVRNLLFTLSERYETANSVAMAVASNFDKLPENVRDILFTLSKKDEASFFSASGVAWAVIQNFDALPADVKNLLFKLSENNETAGGVAMAVAENPYDLPKNVRNKLLLKLSEKDKAAWGVAEAIIENFDNLPENVRNLLFKLSEVDKAAEGVAEAVANNFDSLPENVRNALLFKLSEKGEAVGYVADVIAKNFDDLPKNVRSLLFKLSEKEGTAGEVAYVITAYFNSLPEDVRNLLFKLSEKNEAAEGVAVAVADYFDKLPEDVKNLLFKLSENNETASGVAMAVAKNPYDLPKNVRNKLLLKLSEKDKAAGVVAEAIIENFDNLPENVRNALLFKLSEKDEAVEGVAEAVAEYFDKLPEDVRNKLLFKLSENDKVAKYIAWIVTDTFYKLPEDVRNELIFKLSEKDEAAWVVAEAIVENFDKLPPNIRNLFERPKQQKKLLSIIDDLSWWDKIGVIGLISNAKSKIDKNFAIRVLDKLSRDENEEVRMKAEELMKSIRDD